MVMALVVLEFFLSDMAQGAHTLVKMKKKSVVIAYYFFFYYGLKKHYWRDKHIRNKDNPC